MNTHFQLNIRISVPQVFALRRIGAISVPLLGEEELHDLNVEANSLPMGPTEAQTETGVTQDFTVCNQFQPDSLFCRLADETQDALTKALGVHHVLCTPVIFDDYALQKYPVSAPAQRFAISPHLDYKSTINIVAVYLLRGMGAFCICNDREGNGAVEIPARPGSLILMRATGFNRSSWRPFHFVGPVREERLSFGLRQRVPKEQIYRYVNEGE